MPIPVQCSCGLAMEAPDEMAGQAGECPECQQQFMVPAAADPAKTRPATATQKQATQKRKRSSQSGGQSKSPASAAAQSDPSDMASLLDEVGVQQARGRSSCPNCRASIDPEATICIQCGLNQETGKTVKQKKYASAGGETKADARAAAAAAAGRAKQAGGSHDEALPLGWKVLSLVMPIVGIVIYYKNKKKHPSKAKTAINLASIGIAINLLVMILKNFL